MNMTQGDSSFSKYTYCLYVCIALAVYGILFYLYEPVTLGFDLEDLAVLGVPTVVGLFLFQYYMGTNLFKRAYLGHALIALLWGLTFPLLFHLSYEKPLYFYEFSADFLFGLCLFIGLSLLHHTLTIRKKFTTLVAVFFALVDWLASLIPLAQLGYFFSIWHCITPATLMAFYNTNPEEAFGFLKNTLSIPGLFIAGIGLILWLGILFWSNLAMRKIVTKHRPRRLKNGLGIVAIVGFIAYVPYFLFPQTCIITNWLDVQKYMQEMQTYNTKHEEIYNGLTLTTTETAAQKTPGTIILVIGESSSTDYMKVYNPQFPYEDTPWMSQSITDSNFVFFNHAYSSYVQTVPTLERALSERNQYDDKPFLEAVNILDVARKAGYYTSWFSNQGVYGEYDTAISLLAKTSDNPKWAHESYAFSDQYDGALLHLLKTADPNKNNFIIIHIMGSHIYYNDRYPHEFSKWKKGDVPDGIEAYANSQLYTDWLLQSIYEYGRDHLNLQAMVYFSDHGENIDKSHNPDNFDFTMTRIPLWVYLSPTYRQAYPETANVLLTHKNEYFTNDLLYDMLVGLMHAPSANYDEGRDFSSLKYRFNVNNLTTMLGTEPLTKDSAHR